MQSNELLEQGHAPDAFDSFLDRQKTQRYEDLENHRGMAERQYVDGMHGVLPREVAMYMHREFVHPMKADGNKVGSKIKDHSLSTYKYIGPESDIEQGEIRAMPQPHKDKAIVSKMFYPDGRIGYRTNDRLMNKSNIPSFLDLWNGPGGNMKFV